MIAIQVEPLGPWLRPVTPAPAKALFRASWSDTKKLLDAELRQLDTKGTAALRLDVAEADILRDGSRLRSGIQPATARVALTFDCRHGTLTYATDTYRSWQDNVRAIALSLQSLRAVNRYGVSHAGEQYTGWRAIESGRRDFTTATDAVTWLRSQPDLGAADDVSTLELLRRAARVMHPDVAGDRARWDRLESARRILRGER